MDHTTLLPPLSAVACCTEKCQTKLQLLMYAAPATQGATHSNDYVTQSAVLSCHTGAAPSRCLSQLAPRQPLLLLRASDPGCSLRKISSRRQCLGRGLNPGPPVHLLVAGNFLSRIKQEMTVTAAMQVIQMPGPMKIDLELVWMAVMISGVSPPKVRIPEL